MKSPRVKSDQTSMRFQLCYIKRFMGKRNHLPTEPQIIPCETGSWAGRLQRYGTKVTRRNSQYQTLKMNIRRHCNYTHCLKPKLSREQNLNKCSNQRTKRFTNRPCSECWTNAAWHSEIVCEEREAKHEENKRRQGYIQLVTTKTK